MNLFYIMIWNKVPSIKENIIATIKFTVLLIFKSLCERNDCCITQIENTFYNRVRLLSIVSDMTKINWFL